ncbi:uncharacterized protein LOC119733896 [Patiria miniata]|uniref:C2H2-type domain-containing protein n=1 Tax=Patiria miniata TaxID=46514 RepID=A0A914AHN1_PATMI|nr:uncharacterized protein LOC119733896 [Patiria miniata]
MRKSPPKKTPRDLDEAATVECPTCHDVFLHKRSLERHIKVEHGPQEYYWCGQCEHRNNRRDNLRAHYRDCHPSAQGEVSQIRAETYESRERARRSKIEESGHRSHENHPTTAERDNEARRGAETKSGSSGRGSDHPEAGNNERKRSRATDAGDKPSKKRLRGESAPATVSRAPNERQVEEERPATRARRVKAPSTISRAPDDEAMELSSSEKAKEKAESPTQVVVSVAAEKNLRR